jgi:hypothetical protein
MTHLHEFQLVRDFLQSAAQAVDPISALGFFTDAECHGDCIAFARDQQQPGGGLNDEFEALLAGRTALGRVGEPDHVGGPIAGLSAKQAAGSTRSPSRSPAGMTLIMENIMLDHVFPSISNLDRSIAFYTAALTPLGITQRVHFEGKCAPGGTRT